MMSDAISIRLSGDCTIRSIRTVHREIQTALKTTGDLGIHCAEVERADIAFVQLIAAASRLAAEQTRRLTLVDPSEAVRSAFVRAGLPAYAGQ